MAKRVIRYDPHAQMRMRQRGISEDMVEQALRYPILERPGTAPGTLVREADIGGRRLAVAFELRPNEFYVRTVYWRN
uniref:DUF4258 domain-containing protein n=1 Tax=Acetithermum autotrophicum TaxID=1446466 RepID=H5SUP1_ACEAU|nr:hypothetical protein HGMM_OP4C877 [Candidatus Acetothermum autotrophicum]